MRFIMTLVVAAAMTFAAAPAWAEELPLHTTIYLTSPGRSMQIDISGPFDGQMGVVIGSGKVCSLPVKITNDQIVNFYRLELDDHLYFLSNAEDSSLTDLEKVMKTKALTYIRARDNLIHIVQLAEVCGEVATEEAFQTYFWAIHDWDDVRALKTP